MLRFNRRRGNSTFPKFSAQATAIVGGVLIALAAVTPGMAPVLTFDEAYNMALAKHLANTGQYATEIVGTPLRWFDPYITTGPTLEIPLALVIKFFGTGLVQARAVTLAFLVLLLVSSYIVANRQSSWLGGAIALALLGLLSYDLYDLGLRVLGEVPAVAFLLLSVATLSRSEGIWSFLGGALAALAVLSKPQLIIAAAAILAVQFAFCIAGQRGAGIRTLLLVVGVVVPPAIWNAYQIAVVGIARWLDMNAFTGNRIIQATATLKSLVNAASLTPSTIMLLTALSLLFGMAVIWLVRRYGRALRPVFARLALLMLVTAPLLALRWDYVAYRISYHWRDHQIETALALFGLLFGLGYSLFRLRIGISLMSVVGILFAEWYLGYSEVNPYRYSFFWRIIGLIEAGVALDLIIRSLAGRTKPFMGIFESSPVLTAITTSAGSSLCAVGVIGLLLAHNLPIIQSVPPRNYYGPPEVADWLKQNTSPDTILLGSGWWLPWEVAYVSNLPVADVETSVFDNLSDARRPRFLVIRPELFGQTHLAPDVVSVMQRADLVVFQSGGIVVYRWPTPPEFATGANAGTVVVDLLKDLSDRRLMLTPPPRDGLLDNQHGNFIYPFPRAMTRGVIMISASAMTTYPIAIKSGQSLLVGYTPPTQGDGLTVTVYVDDGGNRKILWSSFLQVEPPSPESYHLKTIPLSEFAGRQLPFTIEVTSVPSGDAISDWLFLGPLVITE
ncbi:MAG: hypothetical protein HYY30_11345 [Chloroflexi bacterium]|nr:hypothetical protein [Chloroflexota bacterium]